MSSKHYLVLRSCTTAGLPHVPTTERLQRAVQQLEITSTSEGKERIAARMSWIPPTLPRMTAAPSVCVCVCACVRA